MFNQTPKILAQVLRLFKKDYQNSNEMVEEKDIRKITEITANLNITSINSPVIKGKYLLLTINCYSESTDVPLIIDLRRDTMLSAINYFNVKKLKDNKTIIAKAKEAIKKSLNQPAKVVVKERIEKNNPRFVIILYPTSQKPEALLFTTSNRRSSNLDFEMEKNKTLWSWQPQKGPEDSGIFLIKINS